MFTLIQSNSAYIIRSFPLLDRHPDMLWKIPALTSAAINYILIYPLQR